MATQKLTYGDVELIFKAFEALESQDSRDALLEAMVGGGLRQLPRRSPGKCAPGEAGIR